MVYFVTCLLAAVLVGNAFASPVASYEPERRPRGAVSELGQRLASHSRLQDSITSADPRLPLPTPQELDAIKKVAQILVMLGEQVIPAILGDTAPPPAHGATCGAAAVEDAPNDPVNLD